MVRGQNLPKLDAAVTDWINANGPKPKGGALSADEVAAYVLSVVGTLLQAAGNMTMHVHRTTGFPALTEEQFVAMARECYGLAQKQAKQAPQRPKA